MSERERLALEGGTPVRRGAWPDAHVIDTSDEEMLREALLYGEWSHGEWTERFERAFAAFCGARYCLLVTNGTAALKLALLAAGIRPGDEVIVPGMTWASVPLAVLECGAEPVPVDVDLDTMAITWPSVDAAISQRTAAVVPTHLFSSQCDLLPIVEEARRRGLFVIEDCAHAPGARRHGRMLGTFGDAAFFSFNQKKLLACGEGGCLVTNDASLHAAAARLREVNPLAPAAGALSGTHLVSAFQAAVLLSQLEKYPPLLVRLERAGELLRRLLSEIEGIQPLARLPGTELQTFYNFCFRVSGAPDIVHFRQALAAELGLPMGGGYLPLSDSPALCAEDDLRFMSRGRHLARVLPNCRRAHYEEAVRFAHRALRADDESLHLIAEAVAKVRRLVSSGR
jgi:dTDP-4-amino-4,6-dideoxygalactose transaminase